MKFSEALKQFGEYQRDILGRSENTVKSYAFDVMNFAKSIGIEEVSDASKKDAENYFKQLAENGASASTRCRKISALQMFYGWAYDNTIVSENPVKSLAKPKIPQKKVLAMENAEVHKVVEVARGRDTSHKDYFRNLTLIHLMFSTGLRRNEIVNIHVSDVNVAENSLLVRVGKGNKQRIVYYNDTAKNLLSEWIVSHRKLYKYAEQSEYLFITQKAPQMCVSAVNDLVNSMFEEAGIKEKGYTVHSTRKAFATTVYSATKDIVTVQNLLGHTNPQVTMRYVGIDESAKRNAAQLVNF